MKTLLPRLGMALLVVLPSTISAQDAIHFWPLDETFGNTAVDLNGGAHGTLQNGPVWAIGSGYLGNGLLFDGIDDRVDVGPLDITTGSGFSIACWVRPSSTLLQEQFVIAKAYDPLAGDIVWSLGTAENTKVRFRLRTAGASSAVTSAQGNIYPGAFYHLAATWDGAQMNLFVNGTLVASSPKTGALGTHPQALASMGHLDIGPGIVPFEGIIGDVRIWDRGLAQAEVIDLVLEQDVSMGLTPSASALLSADVHVHDISGRFVGTFPWSPGGLNEPAVPSGIYLLTWMDGQQRRSTKWMKP